MKKIIKLTSASLPHETIAALAQQLWEQDGRQTNRTLEYWLKAEQQLTLTKIKSDAATASPAAKSSAWPLRARAAASR